MALTPTEEALVRQLLDQQAAILSLAGNEATITSKLGATKVTLSDLLAASAVGNTDLFLTRQGTTDKSVTALLLKNSLSSFVQAGTGAITRPVQDKLRERISPYDFGAVGDGVANDTDAVQKAATAAIGKVLVFPDGIFKIIGGFSFNGDDCHILGEGGVLQYEQTLTHNHCVRMQGNNCSIRNLSIVCSEALVRDDTGFGISIGNRSVVTKNFLIDGCNIRGIASAAIWVSNVESVIVTNNVIERCKADGVHFSDGCSGIVCDSNSLYDNGDDHIAVVNDTIGTPYVSNFVISNNTIRDGTDVASVAGHGIVAIGASAGIITGNLIANTKEPGVGAYLWTDTYKTDAMQISGNTIVSCGNGTTFGGCAIGVSQGLDFAIKGNHISNLSYDGAKPQGAIRITSARNLDISDNFIYDFLCDGIVVQEASMLTIRNNSFGYAKRTPIIVNNAVVQCIVSGNTMSDNNAALDIDINIPSGTASVFGNKASKGMSVVAANKTISREETETHTATITAQSGTITTASGTVNVQRKGKFALVDVSITVTNNGTGASSLICSLPFSCSNGVLNGRENAISGKQLTAICEGAAISIRTYDNLYPAANGSVIQMSGVLELS